MNSRYFLRKIVISNRFINNSLFTFWRLSNNGEKKKIADRSTISIEDIESLSKPLKRCPYDNVLDNSFYGIASSIKQYSDYNKRLNFFIEHGVYFGSVIHPYEKDYYIPNIIVPSLVRERHLQKKITKKILTIGPYIHYAKEYLDENSFYTLKQRLGKVLLVFPDHSMVRVDSAFDNTILISNIENLKKDFNTVMICLYWKDVILGRASDYLKRGYEVVTCGHMLDDNFLSRLKLILKLSDITISNSVGTHLGYSIYLGKPHTVFKQKIVLTSSNSKNLKYEKSVYNDKSWSSKLMEMQEVESSFSDFSTSISDKQFSIVDKYWGISEIKSPIELHNSLENGETKNK